MRFTQPRVFVPTLGLLAALALTAVAVRHEPGDDAPAARAERRTPAQVQGTTAVDPMPAAAATQASGPAPDAPEEKPAAASAVRAATETVIPAWELTDDSTHPFDHRVGELLPKRRALNLDPSRLRHLRGGDALALALPDMGTVQATVERVTRSGGGDVGVFAALDGLGETSMLVLTIGHSALFGTVTTPRGNYLIEGLGGTAAIFEDHLDELIDPSQTDERLPPETAGDLAEGTHADDLEAAGGNDTEATS